MSRSKSIYEIFNEYTKEQINEAISKLTKYEQEILYKIYGNELSSINSQQLTEDEKKTYKSINIKLKGLLANPNKKTRKRFNSIYKYFSEYSMEQVDEAISKLPNGYIEILHLKFGEDLKNPVIKKNSLTATQKSKFSNVIIPKITKLLSSTIEQENSQKQVAEQKDIDKQKIIEIKDITDEEIPMFLDTEPPKLTKEDYEIVLWLIKTPLFIEMIKLLTPIEAMVVSLSLVNSDNSNFSVNDIAKFIGVEPQQVIEITKKALLTYKNNFNNLIDKVIETATNGPILIKE